MNRCKIKKGIFVQRECKQLTNVQCDQCSTDICDHHSKTTDTGQYCLKCYQSQFSEDSDPLRIEEDGYYLWYWNTRSSYYTDYHNNQVFDERDYSGFEYVENSNFDSENEMDDFFDS